MPRPRNRKNRDLPPHLYRYPDGSYLYERPDGKRFSLGSHKARAIAMAVQLDAELRPPDVAMESRMRAITGKDGNLLRDALDRYIAEHLVTKGLAPKSLGEAQRMLNAARTVLGAWPLDRVGIREIAEFLDAMPANTGNKHRGQLAQFFAWTVAKGLTASNPAALTLKQREQIERQRLSLDAYLAIHEVAEPWFQNAMDLGLQTLQRRQDLCVMRFADIVDGRLCLQQQKTERHGTGRLAIRITAPLAAVIDRCRDDLLSPYLLHRRPERKVTSARKDHWTQIVPEMLSRTFQELRDRLGLYSPLKPEQRPSFHEIRALGALLYKESGTDPQALLGHTSAKMTDVYLGRHQTEFVEVSAGLVLRGNS